MNRENAACAFGVAVLTCLLAGVIGLFFDVTFHAACALVLAACVVGIVSVVVFAVLDPRPTEVSAPDVNPWYFGLLVNNDREYLTGLIDELDSVRAMVLDELEHSQE